MPRAVWNDQVIAESNTTELIEGNHYFPPNSLKTDFFEASATTSVCSWKGTANYYTLNVGGRKNTDAAWYYADPKEQAATIRGYVAFWKGVRIEATPDQVVNESPDGGSCEV